MRDQKDFASRIDQITKTAKKNGVGRPSAKRRLGDRLIIPVMFACCLAGGITVAWDMQERPTNTPLEFAAGLITQVLSYF